MIRLVAAAMLCATIGCSSAPAEPRAQASSPDAYTGRWRSVTPSLEFVRLSVNTKSSELDALAARLTFSGVAWDGAGGVQGDSMVVQMAMSGRAEPSGVLVAHPSDARTLRVQMRTGAAAPLDLTFVRE